MGFHVKPRMPDETLWMVSKSRSRGREENYGQAQVIELRGKNVCVCVFFFFFSHGSKQWTLNMDWPFYNFGALIFRSSPNFRNIDRRIFEHQSFAKGLSGDSYLWRSTSTFCPTEHSTILEPQNPRTEVLEVHKIWRARILKLQNCQMFGRLLFNDTFSCFKSLSIPDRPFHDFRAYYVPELHII